MKLILSENEINQRYVVTHQGRRQRVRGEGAGGALGSPLPPTISWSKIFFHVKTENTKFLHVNNIREFFY